MVRVLSVEDDERIRAVLSMALEQEGYEVLAASSAEKADEMLANGPQPDIALIDITLPGRNGLEFCRELREQSDLPIVMVTARAESHDVIIGLEAGADDYITKPFVFKELDARIKALLRRARPPEKGSEKYEFGDLVILPKAGLVQRAEQELDLTKTEFRLLCELAHQAGMVVSREELLHSVWGYDYFSDGRLVDAHIRRLRIKVEDNPAEPKLILTVRGRGYKLQS